MSTCCFVGTLPPSLPAAPTGSWAWAQLVPGSAGPMTGSLVLRPQGLQLIAAPLQLHLSFSCWESLICQDCPCITDRGCVESTPTLCALHRSFLGPYSSPCPSLPQVCLPLRTNPSLAFQELSAAELAVPTLSVLFVLNSFLQYSVSGNSFPSCAGTASTGMAVLWSSLALRSPLRELQLL